MSVLDNRDIKKWKITVSAIAFQIIIKEASHINQNKIKYSMDPRG